MFADSVGRPYKLSERDIRSHVRVLAEKRVGQAELPGNTFVSATQKSRLHSRPTLTSNAEGC